MSETEPRRHLGRSILALLAGMFVGVALSLGTDSALHAAGVLPAPGEPMNDVVSALAFGYRSAYNVLATYVVARLAPSRPMQHALLGGAIGLVVSAIGTAVSWNQMPSLGPHWYPLALVITALPCAWLGGRLRTMQVRTLSR
jgi:hypothetical protein